MAISYQTMYREFFVIGGNKPPCPDAK